MAREGITRKSVDLTDAQLAVVEAMMDRMAQQASAAAGAEVTVSTRQFFHAVLKEKAESMGFTWPDDYPAAGGWRGGPKEE